jgi:molecular chaperone Hsp33
MLDTVVQPDERLGFVGGVLLQPLPDADHKQLAEQRRRLREEGDFVRALQASVGADALTFARRLFRTADFELKDTLPLRWQCTCSRERAMDAVQSTGRAEIEDMLKKDGKAEATCTFCSTVHVVTGDDLRAMLSTPQA